MNNSKAILLDVDGVLAPVGSVRQREKSKWLSPWVLIDSTWDMWLNRGMGDVLNRVALEAHADIVWCTAWLQEPESLVIFAEFLGLNVLTLTIPGSFSYSSSVSDLLIPNKNKLQVAAFASTIYEQGCVWIDDDDWKRILPYKVSLVRTESKSGFRLQDTDRLVKALNKS